MVQFCCTIVNSEAKSEHSSDTAVIFYTQQLNARVYNDVIGQTGQDKIHFRVLHVEHVRSSTMDRTIQRGTGGRVSVKDGGLRGRFWEFGKHVHGMAMKEAR